MKPTKSHARDIECERVREQTIQHYWHHPCPELSHILERMTEDNEMWHKLMEALRDSRYEPFEAGTLLSDLYDQVVNEIAEENAKEVE